jgi:hypothetical protein
MRLPWLTAHRERVRERRRQEVEHVIRVQIEAIQREAFYDELRRQVDLIIERLEARRQS